MRSISLGGTRHCDLAGVGLCSEFVCVCVLLLGLGRGMPNTSAVELKKKTKYPGVLIRRWCFRREDSSAFSFLYIYLRAAPRLMRRGGAAASKFVRRRGLAVFPLDASH